TYFCEMNRKMIIPFIFQAAALLAAFTHPSYIVIYAPGDSFTCCRAATRNLLGIECLLFKILIIFHIINLLYLTCFLVTDLIILFLNNLA
ncbi:hypothetical protein, partial [Photorhabdus antumapuensis]|uniref:hypothetical protein n=1 Tax=Photorhabdus antumapuensis TaxID=2862867 RepID=UPI001CEDE23F